MNKTINIRLGMVILLVNDLEKSQDFYTKIGCKQKFALKNHWIELSLGEIKIGLCPTKNEIQNFRTGLVLETNDLMSTYQDWQDAGIEFINEPKTALHGIMISFKDPSGNIIDLYQPTPEKVLDLAKKVKVEDGCCKKEDSCCK